MRVLVLSDPDSWHLSDLKRAANAMGIQIASTEFASLATKVFPATEPFETPDSLVGTADAIIVRTMPAGSLQQIIFRMDALAQFERQGKLVMNPAKSMEAAIDKFLSLDLLNHHGLPVPRTFVSQTVRQALDHFECLGGDVVVKPIFGSRGKGVERIGSFKEAIACFERLVFAGEVIYQQQFINHPGFDIRVFVIGSDCFGMKRSNHGHWVTNINQGGVGEPYELSDTEKKLALDACRSLGTIAAGVDIAYDQSTNKAVVLEVNAVPGWKEIAEVLQTDFAQLLLYKIEAILKYRSDT